MRALINARTGIGHLNCSLCAFGGTDLKGSQLALVCGGRERAYIGDIWKMKRKECDARSRGDLDATTGNRFFACPVASLFF